MNINLKLWWTKDVFCMPEHVSCSYQFPVAYRSLTTKSPMHLFMKRFKTSRLLINQKHQIKIYIDNSTLVMYLLILSFFAFIEKPAAWNNKAYKHIAHMIKRKCLFSYTIFLPNPFSFQFSNSVVLKSFQVFSMLCINIQMILNVFSPK